MKLSPNNQKVVDVLREKQLTYLIFPFKQMVESDKLAKIKVHKMTWKAILNECYNGSRLEIENTLISYLVAFGIVVVKKKRVDKRVSKDRVKKHREDKKSLGYKTISISLDPKTYENLKRYKDKNNMTYAEAIENLVPVIL